MFIWSFLMNQYLIYYQIHLYLCEILIGAFDFNNNTTYEKNEQILVVKC